MTLGQILGCADNIPASALSTPPPLSPPATADVTARAAQAAPAPKAKRARLLQADDELELVDDDFAAPNRDNSDILGEERYIPADLEVVRLREIVDDPATHFLPSVKVGGTTMIYAGPQGLAPELAELFAFPSNILRRDRTSSVEEERASKRPRIEAPEDEEEVEVARRDSMRPASEAYDDRFAPGNDTFDLGPDISMQQEEFQFAEGEFDLTTPRAKRVREASLAPSRAESIARQIQFGAEEGGTYALGMFDTRQPREGESQVSITPSKSVVSDQPSRTSSGYSRNTGMAMGLLRRELEAIEEEDKVLSFEKVADKVGSVPSRTISMLMVRCHRLRVGPRRPSFSSCSCWVLGIVSSWSRRGRMRTLRFGARRSCSRRSRRRRWHVLFGGLRQ